MSSFDHLATVTASTKRNALVNGERSGYVTQLTGLKIIPLCPIDAQRASELRSLMKLDTSFRVMETFVQGNPDIQDNDILVVGTSEYMIRSALPWTFGEDVRLNLILEELKK